MPSDHADPSHNAQTLGRRLHRFLIPVPKLQPPINPALLKREEERAKVRQNRVADRITAFSGSMLFVYLHIIWFGCWIGFRGGGLSVRPADDDRLARGHLPLDLRDDLPEPRRRQAPGDRRPAVENGSGGGQQNEELLDLSRQILTLTKEVRSLTGPDGGTGLAPSKKPG